MEFKIDDNSILKVEKSAWDTLTKYRQINYNTERGGILVGCLTPDHSEYVITRVSTPTVYDKGTYNTFIRSKKSAQEFLNKIWVSSHGYETYLGEWHTHPSKYAVPSLDDRKLLKRSIQKNEVFTDKLFMIILSNVDTREAVKNDYFGYCDNDSKTLKELAFNEK